MNANIYVNTYISEKEIFPEKEDYIFVLHHAFCDENNKSYPYERNPDSQAFIPYGTGKYYITGGVNGGKASAFLKMSAELDVAIRKDLQKGIVAVWHDESFINKYAVENTNYRILSPSFFYPELVGSVKLSVERKIVARDKRKYFDVNSFKNISKNDAENSEKNLSDSYYYRICLKWLILSAHQGSVLDYLKNFHNIAIYSYRNLGEVLIDELEQAHLEDIIECVLDPEPEKYDGKYKICKPYEFDESIDLIVVTEAFYYSKIMPSISMFSDIAIVSLEDIINMEIIKRKIKIDVDI